MGRAIRVNQIPKKLCTAPQIALVVGLIFGLFLVGISRVNPINTEWIVNGDRLGNQIAWNYFRRSGLLQWPINRISNYGFGWSNFGHGSNLFISIPLKFFNALLPNNFQFIGLWIVACCALQTYFAAKIIGIFTDASFEIVVLSLNFLIFPIFLMRIGMMGHPQLGAQWLLLLGMYLIFSENFKPSRWVMLLAITFFIDLYLAAILIVLVLFFLVACSKESKKNLEKYSRIKLFSLVIAVSVSLLFLQGYFSLPEGVLGSGFFRISPITFLNPRISDRTSFSLFANILDPVNSNYVFGESAESFLYLGAGFLIFAIIFSLFRTANTSMRIFRKLFPVFLASLALFIIALSNQISLASYEFHYWWPNQLLTIRQIFRSASRFGWPLAYLTGFFVCFKAVSIDLRNRFRKLLIVALLLLNVIDLSPLFRESQKDFRKLDNESLLVRNNLKGVFSNYSKIYIYPVFDLQVDDLNTFESEQIWRETKLWQDVLIVASELNMQSNFAYVSRPVGEVVERANRDSEKKLAQGTLAKGDLFIFVSRDDINRTIGKIPTGFSEFSIGKLILVGMTP